MASQSFRLMSLVLLLIAIAALCPPASTAHGQDLTVAMPRIERRVLDNGLEVLVAPLPGAQSATVDMWVSVGSINESAANNGIAHFFEHMVFKGTATRTRDDIMPYIAALGGTGNAATSLDWTHYYFTVPAAAMDEALAVLADITFNATFPRAEIAVERGVVASERNAIHGNPMATLDQELSRRFYATHPYGRPPIGTANALNRLVQRDFLRWNATYYVPGNMTLVVTGKVDPEMVFALAEELFSAAPAAVAPPLDLPKERGPATLTVEEIVGEYDQGYLMMAWPAPEIEQFGDSAAMDVLLNLLSGGRTARFYTEIERDLGIVDQLHASYYTTQDPGIFQVSASFPYGNRAAVEAAILHELQRILDGDLTAAEVDRAKSLLLTDVRQALAEPGSLAYYLGFYTRVAGDYLALQQYVDAVAALTPAEVVAMAHTYIDPARYLEVVFAPEDPMIAAQTSAALAAIDDGMDYGAEMAAHFAAAPPAATLALDAHAIYTETLPNGLRIVLQPDPEVDNVVAVVAVDAGSYAEPPGKAGLTLVTLLTMLSATSLQAEADIFGQIADLGGDLSMAPDAEVSLLYLDAPATAWPAALPLLAEVVVAPALASADVARTVDDIAKSLTASASEPGALAFSALMAAMYGPDGIGAPVTGDAASLAAITTADVRAYYQARFAPQNMTVSVGGNFEPEPMLAAVRHYFGALPVRDPSLTPLPTIVLTATQTITRTYDGQQAWLLVAAPGPARDSADAAAAQLAAYVLGGRIDVVLRQRNGWAYASFGNYIPTRGDGVLLAGAIVQPSRADATLAEILRLIELQMDEPVTAEELALAQNALIGQNQRLLDQPLGRAAQLGEGLLVHGDPEWLEQAASALESVTAEEVQRVGQRYFAGPLAIIRILPEP